MTALELLALIVAAMLAQLAAGLGAAWWRWSQRRASVIEHAPAAARAPGSWAGWRAFRVAERAFEDRAHTQCSFYLEPVDGVPLPPFRPGQFLTLSWPQAADGAAPAAFPVGLTRCYSLSDKPDPKGYRITVKRVLAPFDQPACPPGAFSNLLHERIQVGDILNLRPPAGQFFIDEEPSVAAVLIAGGIGVTPMMSMLRWALAEQPDRTLHLYYGVRHGDEHVFKAALEQLAQAHPHFHLNVVYSRAQAQDRLGVDYQHQGHVDIDLLRRTLPHGRHQFYICGPTAMMDTLVPALVQWGVPRQDIHFEAFGPASISAWGPASGEPVARLAQALDVRFRKSGRTLAWDGQDANLLDFAERNGVRVEAGCRAGSCGSCETRVLGGEVAYSHPPDFELSPGHCLLCVGVPKSALEIDA